MTGFGQRLAGLLLVASALCVVIVIEITDRQGEQSNTHVLLKNPAHDRQAKSVSPVDQSDGWLHEILVRPLFSPDRRPLESDASSLRGMPRLTGIVIASTHRIAIFAAPSGGHTIVAEAGTRVGAYEVTAITDTGVSVAGPEGTSVIRPIFDAAPAAAPKPSLMRLEPSKVAR